MLLLLLLPFSKNVAVDFAFSFAASLFCHLSRINYRICTEFSKKNLTPLHVNNAVGVEKKEETKIPIYEIGSNDKHNAKSKSYTFPISKPLSIPHFHFIRLHLSAVRNLKKKKIVSKRVGGQSTHANRHTKKQQHKSRNVNVIGIATTNFTNWNSIK